MGRRPTLVRPSANYRRLHCLTESALLALVHSRSTGLFADLVLRVQATPSTRMSGRDRPSATPWMYNATTVRGMGNPRHLVLLASTAKDADIPAP